jgi:hypothetical protein
MASQASWSPLRQRWISASIVSGVDGSAESDDMRVE